MRPDLVRRVTSPTRNPSYQLELRVELEVEPPLLAGPEPARQVHANQAVEEGLTDADAGERTPRRTPCAARTGPAQVAEHDRARAVEPRNAFVISHLLQEVTRSGTAARAQAVLKRNDIYGKTGTTNDSMDAWFAGYHTSLTAVTWIGYDTPRKLGDRETGGGLSLPVWISYMQHALRNTPVNGMPVPAGVVFEGNDWFYSEYAHGNGVSSLGIDGKSPEPDSADPEKKKILDMFKE